MGYKSNKNLKHHLKVKSFHNVFKISVIVNFAGDGNISSPLI